MRNRMTETLSLTAFVLGTGRLSLRSAERKMCHHPDLIDVIASPILFVPTLSVGSPISAIPERLLNDFVAIRDILGAG